MVDLHYMYKQQRVSTEKYVQPEAPTTKKKNKTMKNRSSFFPGKIPRFPGQSQEP